MSYPLQKGVWKRSYWTTTRWQPGEEGILWCRGVFGWWCRWITTQSSSQWPNEGGFTQRNRQSFSVAVGMLCVLPTIHTDNMGILSGWIASRREEVHGPESQGSRSKDPDVGRNREDSRTRHEVWCIACGESHDDLPREVCQKGSVGEGRRRSGSRVGATTMIKATTVKQERTEQYAAIFIARWNLAWLWLTEVEVDAERKLKFVVKKKEKVYASSWKLCSRQWWELHEMRKGNCVTWKSLVLGARRELKQTLTRNSGSGQNAHMEGHDLLRVVSAGGETLTWCRKCSRYSRFRLERKHCNRFESTLLNWNTSV